MQQAVEANTKSSLVSPRVPPHPDTGLIDAGFGWTNGVVLYLAGEYGQYLAPVSCPLIPIVEIEGYPESNGTASTNGTTSTNGTEPSNGTEIEQGEGGGVQNQTQARIFAGHRIPRQ